MVYRRGFKTDAEAHALEQRKELGLGVTDQLDPFALASFLEIPFVSFAACVRLVGASGSQTAILSDLREHVSAVTVFSGRRRIIVFNDGNAPTRQRSDMSHEISHTLLEHTPVALDDPSRYTPNAELEAEAEFLGGALLIPRDGALELMCDGMSETALAEHFGVSLAMARWRIRGTGVDKHAQRIRARKTRPLR